MIGLVRAVLLSLGLLACTARTEPADAMGEAVVVGAPSVPRCDEIRDSRAAFAGSGYRFELNGEPFFPAIDSLSGGFGSPREGDVITVRDLSMVLGPPGIYRYSSAPNEPWWSVELALDDAPRQIAAMRLMDRAPSGLGIVALGRLRGLVVDTDDPDVMRLDVATMFVEQTHVYRAESEGSAWMPLPPSLRYLRLHVRSTSDPVRDAVDMARALAEISRLADLRYLEIVIDERPGHEPLALDVGSLASLTKLERLELRGAGRAAPIRGLDRLAALVHLRALELDNVTPTELSFVATLPALTWLKLEHLAAVDLRPLSAHPRLTEIHVETEKLASLPDPPPPSLRTLTLLSPQVEPEQVAAMRARAPAAHIRGDWNMRVAEELVCATKIRVRAGCRCAGCDSRLGACSGCVCGDRGGAILFESTEEADRSQLALLLTTEEGDAETSCFGGAATIEFLRADDILAAVEFDASVMHGADPHLPRLRWSDGGRSVPRRLPEANVRPLCAWFARHGAAHVCEHRLPPP